MFFFSRATETILKLCRSFKGSILIENSFMDHLEVIFEVTHVDNSVLIANKNYSTSQITGWTPIKAGDWETEAVKNNFG